MVRSLVSMAVVVYAPAAPAAARVKGFYVRGVGKEGRIYVFTTPERCRLWQISGDMGRSITLIGRGASGETAVAGTDSVIDLFLFTHGPPAYDRPTPPAPPAALFPQVKVGGLCYLSYQDRDAHASNDFRFSIKQGCLNVEATIAPWVSARITAGTTDFTGDITVRLTYAHAKFACRDHGFVSRPEGEVGGAHMPSEAHRNNHRLHGTMFMERNRLFHSADIGVTFLGLLGGTVSKEYQKTVSKAYPGTWGRPPSAFSTAAATTPRRRTPPRSLGGA